MVCVGQVVALSVEFGAEGFFERKTCQGPSKGGAPGDPVMRSVAALPGPEGVAFFRRKTCQRFSAGHALVYLCCGPASYGRRHAAAYFAISRCRRPVTKSMPKFT